MAFLFGDNMSIGIYKITNTVNGKVYVGQSVTIEQRWIQHKNRPCNQHIKNAYTKYGISNFKFEIIHEIFEVDKKLLNELEIYYIGKYNSRNHDYGYNACVGGDSRAGRKMGIEERLMRGASQKGKKMSEDAKRKMSEWHKGKVVKESTKQKLSEITKKQFSSPESRQLAREKTNIQFQSKEMRELIGIKSKEYYSKEENRQHQREMKRRKMKPIRCIETGIVYESIRDAHRKTGAQRCSIKTACEKNGTAIGLHWEYLK